MNREQRKNKELTEEFPFLLPHNKFSGRVPDAYEYEYTELDMLPEGWKNAFGLDMVKDLKEILVKHNCMEKYRIYDIKEKWGVLRWDDLGVPDSAETEHAEWLDKYEELSAETCASCGRPAQGKTKWSVPCCTECMHGSRLRR